MTSNEDIEMHSADPEGSPSKDQAAHEDKNESWAFEQRTPSQNHPSRFKFWLAVTVLCLEVFLVTLDSTILAPATPKIPDDFHLLKDVGWYCSIYPMAICICLSWSSSCVQHSHAGRAIAGLGSSGLLIGAFFLVPFLAPPARRPISLGLISTSRGVATTFGPLIGDAFTERVSWRWNFYANLPLSAFTLATLSAYCTLAALVPSVICLLLALQWGEWFQGVKGASPIQPRVSTLPWVTTCTIIALAGGLFIAQVGLADMFMGIGTVLSAVEPKLFTTFDLDTSSGKWVGYQIIYAMSSSISSMAPIMVVENTPSLHDIPLAPACLLQIRRVYSSIFVSMAQALFTDNLTSGLQQLGV
ncbi:major facilitator superfamily domain-containing protein [Aspergillus alliaceus]|uniref:major facilitator superfamily domain-containing protein n=1 Tax=Petromyces alliaceus TaxID=209559 RepID=UPI0012A5D966|nr:major facilitator superfamily domain-containing protein [Aspergillus alliaceus]KAB8228343.1 major facilitator superfamily domain-containing protein [Aspergillus alliaceus]